MQNERRDPSRRPTGAAEITERLRALREIVSSPRLTTEQQQRALETIDRESADLANMTHNGSRERDLRRLLDNNNVYSAQESTTPSQVAQRRRRQSRPLSRVIRDQDRLRRAIRQDPLDQPSTSTSRLSPLMSSRTRQASEELEAEPQRDSEARSSKRRKLEDGSSDNIRDLPSYGIEGTLVPGNLKMTVLDVGPASNNPPLGDQVARLKLWMADNRDVYRSGRRRCNIMMKHLGGWPFTLSTLVVKMPKHDRATSPLQGMVFVGMDSDDLQTRAEHYDSFLPLYHPFHMPRTHPFETYRPRSPYHRARPTNSRPATNAFGWTTDTHSPAQVQTVADFDVSIEHLSEDEEDDGRSPQSPRYYDEDAEDPYYSRPTYDSYRPNYDNPPGRYTTSRPTEEHDPPSISGSGSGSGSESEDEETLLYNSVPPTRRQLDESETMNRRHREGVQAYHDRGEGYTYLNNTEPDNDGEYPYRHAPPRYTYPHPRSGSSSPRHSFPPLSTKRLPGCNEMLRGRGPGSDTDDTDQALASTLR